MELVVGDGTIEISLDTPFGSAKPSETFEIRIEHEGTGSDGTPEGLPWVSGVTREQLRELAEELLRLSK